MMHFFRRSKIHLDCFTSRSDVITYAPIKNGIEAIPNWWKELPKTSTNPLDGFSPATTMKTCVGMYDYYNKSVAMPLWSDLCINIEPSGGYSWKFSDNVSDAHVHPRYQYAGFMSSGDYGHLKLISPWVLKTKLDLNWVFTDPIYSHRERTKYILAQGLLNFSRQHGLNLQLFIDTKNTETHIIPFNTTFLLTPLTDKKVVVHRHLVSKEKYDAINNLSRPITFINKYKLQQKLTKCPYKDEIK